MTNPIGSFIGLFRKCRGDIEPSVTTPLNSLPKEILAHILNFVCDPTHTALVSKNFYETSQNSYKILLEQCEGYSCLAQLIPSQQQPELKPAQKIQALYLLILREARSCGIDPKVIKPKLPSIAPDRLEKIRGRTIPRLHDKFHVYLAIFHRVNRLLAQALDHMTLQRAIEFSEKSLKSREMLYSSRPTMLDLGYHHLTYLPPLIGELKALKNLKLHDNDLTFLPIEMKSLTKLATLHLNGNPLSSKNVKEVCQSLPGLKTVFVDNEQPDLIEMFQTHFPDLQLEVVQILRLEEEI